MTSLHGGGINLYTALGNANCRLQEPRGSCTSCSPEGRGTGSRQGRSVQAAWGLLQQPLVPPGGSATPAQCEQPIPGEGFVVASPDTCPWEQHRVLRGHAWLWWGYLDAHSPSDVALGKKSLASRVCPNSSQHWC